ncbi:hypothetical protein MKK64_19110 [Methylobacterium sp. E-025]|uniref:hypothetical protein n=1 Tax=Methylobacterium sp. E-025 TaxID=2836561 RepID=UPI001FBAB007|nr:hypothetical protein [Methylobacterium sp. E-025]MCJ2113289.1 hypothetical protein [Methylobacterium sp. E-025]
MTTVVPIAPAGPTMSNASTSTAHARQLAPLRRKAGESSTFPVQPASCRVVSFATGGEARAGSDHPVYRT